MVPRGADFSPLARPDHAEVEVESDASAASRRMKKGRSPKATALMSAHEKRPERQAERGAVIMKAGCP